MGGTPPPQNFPIQKFNKALADLMEEAGIGHEEPAAQAETAMDAKVEEAAVERLEKRMLVAQIKALGGDANIKASFDDLEIALSAAMTPNVKPDPVVVVNDEPVTLNEPIAEDPDGEIEPVDVQQSEADEKEDLKAEIKALGGRVPHGMSGIGKFRDVAAALRSKE